MNWNSFGLYTKLPCTVQSSNEIARIGWLLSQYEGALYDYRFFMWSANDIVLVKCVCLLPKTLISCGFAGLSLCEAGSFFELFYRKAAPLCSVTVAITWFFEKAICGVFLKKRKICKKNIYPGSLFRHRFSHKPVSFSAHKAPQIEPAICTPASDGGVVRYRTAHTRPRFFVNPPRRNSPFDMLLPA